MCFGAQVLYPTMHGPLKLWRGGGWGGVPKWGWGKIDVEVVQHLATVPGPAYSGGLVVTGVHAQRRPVRSGAGVTRGYAQAQRGAQVEQATPGHPLPALVVFLTGGCQDEGVIPHPQAPLGALMEESEIARVQRRCAERGKQWHQSITLMKATFRVSSKCGREEVSSWINISINGCSAGSGLVWDSPSDVPA